MHDGIDRQPAESWSARYNEGQLRIEPLQLMRQIGIPSPRLRSRSFAA